MKQTVHLASFYSPIQNEKDAETILSDMSIFWYVIGIVLIFIFLTVSILTKEVTSILFPIILVSAGYLLSRRKSRVLSSFILVYSLALNGVAVWFFSRSTIADFTHGISSNFYNPHLIATILFFLSCSLIILLLALCSWAAGRSFMATFVYHKKIGSQIFWRNIFLVSCFVFVLPYLVPSPYLFSEIPWQHKKYVDIYKYFKENLFFANGTQLISIISLIFWTKYFPLVNTSTNISNRLESLYKPILNAEDAERVLLDLSIFFYAFGVLWAIFQIVLTILNSPRTLIYYITPLINLIIFLFAGYSLPRRKSRMFSLVVLIILIYMSAVAMWFFLYKNPPSFGLWVVENLVSLFCLFIPFTIIFITWVAIRTTMATFIYHRYHSQLKKV